MSRDCECDKCNATEYDTFVDLLDIIDGEDFPMIEKE